MLPDNDCDDRENYWKLIGKTGVLVNSSNDSMYQSDIRVLIQFDEEIENFGLECHNLIPNALWILKEDLVKI